MDIADEKFRASSASEVRVWPFAENFFSALPGVVLRHFSMLKPQSSRQLVPSKWTVKLSPHLECRQQSTGPDFEFESIV
ncbi:hypothetical protein CORC01_08387 [Colletotrichum orchidophilum]|uniref:Uncharacterized protein n=1 Tax=Colletotrichum orchidophilum TaxID=1209926 RepID=A0A1G4B4U0_9PEZI|nr:uncharacterized protein CORC01_08387 [Colletotrichum orchidophilum]OHE96315.1 hypothetical protein CORC01_08387 [Colletotrichum orchidophilum]